MMQLSKCHQVAGLEFEFWKFIPGESEESSVARRNGDRENWCIWHFCPFRFQRLKFLTLLLVHLHISSENILAHELMQPTHLDWPISQAELRSIQAIEYFHRCLKHQVPQTPHTGLLSVTTDIHPVGRVSTQQVKGQVAISSKVT